MNSKQSNLLNEINTLRVIMMDIANKQGFDSTDVLKHSQRLDQVIYEYQKVVYNDLKKSDLNSMSSN